MDLGKEVIDLACPHCGHRIEQRAERLKKGALIDCPSCHQSLRIESSNVPVATAKVNKVVADFRRSLGKVARKR